MSAEHTINVKTGPIIWTIIGSTAVVVATLIVGANTIYGQLDSAHSERNAARLEAVTAKLEKKIGEDVGAAKKEGGDATAAAVAALQAQLSKDITALRTDSNARLDNVNGSLKDVKASLDESGVRLDGLILKVDSLPDKQAYLVECETTRRSADAALDRAKDMDQFRIVEYVGTEDFTVWVFDTRRDNGTAFQVHIVANKPNNREALLAAAASLDLVSKAYNDARSLAYEAVACVDRVMQNLPKGGSSYVRSMASAVKSKAELIASSANDGIDRIAALKKRLR